MDPADLPVLGPDDVVRVLEGVQRIEREDRVIAIEPGGLLQLGSRPEPEERLPAEPVRDTPVVEPDPVLVGGVLGDERLQHLQGILSSVLPPQMPAQPLAVLAVDLPARLLGHAGNPGGGDRRLPRPLGRRRGRG
jgi:hypothetical protein